MSNNVAASYVLCRDRELCWYTDRMCAVGDVLGVWLSYQKNQLFDLEPLAPNRVDRFAFFRIDMCGYMKVGGCWLE